MVSIIASPTNKVREMVPAASGWRAMASMAAATARPSPSAGPDRTEGHGKGGGEDADDLDQFMARKWLLGLFSLVPCLTLAERREMKTMARTVKI